MKVRVPMMVQDPMTAADKMRIVEGFDITKEQFLLDGPTSERVAVLDLDAKTGTLCSGVRFVPASEGRKLGRYAIKNQDDIYAADFMQTSVFATVLKTMYLFEDEHALGRRVQWAFNAPQLLVVPRAGEWANAFYERESHSLQFFYFPSPTNGSQVYTSLSRDIVAHETGHALLDGIARDLYNAISPESVAMHEAVADLTAMLMAFNSFRLREQVLAKRAGSIAETNAFSAIAEQFGQVLYPERGSAGLRSLKNTKCLSPDRPGMEYVREDEPHTLSQVLSGALYEVMVKIHDEARQKIARKRNISEFSASGEALMTGADRFAQLLLRGCDYLCPGEISFADLGRAMIAADQAAFPRNAQYRDWIADEFIRRGIAADHQALQVESDIDYRPLKEIDLNALIDSEWAAYQFASENRSFLGVPDGVNLRVLPRQRIFKRNEREDDEQLMSECLFKVTWDHYEPNELGDGYPAKRQITLGTTLAIDRETKKVLAKLTCHPDEQRAARDRFLGRLIEQGILLVGRRALGPNGRWLASAVRAETTDGLMRVRSTARMLHIAGPYMRSQEA